MVYYKVRLLAILFSFFLFGCNIHKGMTVDLHVGVGQDQNKNYCFNGIKDTLTKVTKYEQSLKNSNYSHLDQKGFKKRIQFIKKNYKDKIEGFIEGSSNIEAYLMENKKMKFLILIGKALGATGIGVDYWNYQCYSLSSDKEIVYEFSSLINTPYSFYANANNAIGYFEVEDDFPNPADGKEIKLNYKPLMINIFSDSKKELIIDFRCEY